VSPHADLCFGRSLIVLRRMDWSEFLAVGLVCAAALSDG
jgi:hypothetical protein